MEIVAAALLLFTLISVSADREPPVAEDTPVTEHAHQADAPVRADLSAYSPTLPACGPGVLYRNLSVPAERAVYWSADGRRCDPEGST
jgi:hypothetical protein